MSNLMREGVYEKRFLDDYGAALVATEKTMRLPDRYWNNPLGAPTHLTFGGAAGDAGRPPMTGFMKALAHNPDAATAFFDRTEPQDAAEWVLTKRRPFADGPGGDGPYASREATGAALVAAATGIDPGDEKARFVEHTDAHRQVLRRSLAQLAGLGDEVPAEFRDDMAKVLANHGDELHRSASALDDESSPLDRKQLLEVAKQVSRDRNAYGILNEGLIREISHDIHHDKGGDPKETLHRAGYSVGFLEEARYQALKGDKADPSWDAKWGYHIGGTIANLLPQPIGDIAQRGVDAIAYAWQVDEQKRINEEAGEQNAKVFGRRETQLKAIAEEWQKAGPHRGSVNLWSLQREIGADAYDGNRLAKGLAGDQ
ncbi:hypothetical protein [Streptomyces sp. URMC 123]|uniref:hypothetical protein n=1 Tax=Streptomyces sp. URMC 123 TaxID=3423403 RepID=UPI003F1BB9E0